MTAPSEAAVHDTASEIGNEALGVLREVFGYTAFRGRQQAIIEHVVGGGDALVLMPTGGGKSLCYQMPALLRPGTAIVVSPLIALMQDQVEALQPARRGGGVPQFQPGRPGPGRSRAALRRRRTEAALCRARALADRSLPGPAGARGAVAVRHRRGALRVAVGPRLPSRIPSAHGAARALPRRAAHRPDRHRRRADPARDRRAPGAGRGRAVRGQLRPPQHPLRAWCTRTSPSSS